MIDPALVAPIDPDLKLITLEKQADGNWIGTTTKFGKELVVREVGPETALQRILTDNGNTTTT